MVAGGAIIRGERWRMAFAEEATYGAGPIVDPTNLSYIFGVVQSATLPDSETEFIPFWAAGTSTSSIRNWYIAYRGRQELKGSIPDILVLDGRALYLPIGAVVDAGVDNAYTHTITDAYNLKSICIQVENTDSAGSLALTRRYLGGKVNRATYSASEGDFLKMSIDEITFLDYKTSADVRTDFSVNHHYIDFAAKAIPTLTYPNTEPYLFSYGVLEIEGTTFARIRDFRLTVDNSLEPKYYITNAAAAYQLPYEYREGRRTYAMGLRVDVEDNAIYKHLVRQGSYSDIFRGFKVKLTFTRPTPSVTDKIEIYTPYNPTAPTAAGNEMGCLIRSARHNIVTDSVLSVDLDVICRNIAIVVTDDIDDYPGE